MSYLYEEGDGGERRAFEAHLATCAACTREVAALKEARGSLAAWAPPDTMLDFRIVHGAAPAADAAPKRARFAWLTVPQLPLWAQLAAASLVIGVAVGISGFEVRYDQQGLTVRAGWNKPAAADTSSAPAPTQTTLAPVTTTADAAPWRAELTAMEERIRGDMRQQPANAAVPAPRQASNAGTMTDEQFMARVQQLIFASESRQRSELAMRLGQVTREMDTQRRADLARVVNGMGALEGRTGTFLASQRDLLNYLVRVSQKDK